MERRRSQKSQMRPNVSEQSVVLDSGARVPESEVTNLSQPSSEDEKREKDGFNKGLFVMNYDYDSKGGRQPDGCPNEHGS